MSYAFPSALAEQVISRWRTFVARHDRPAPPLPSVEQLHFILETAFFASFAREEGRDLRFVMCCATDEGALTDGAGNPVPVVAFDTRRQLSIDAVRSLAPAVSPTNAAMLVRFNADKSADHCEIAGVLNVGSNLARARSGRSIYQRPAPYALVIDVRDAGELHVYRGGIKLATLKAGSLQDQLGFSELEFLPISDILASGLDAMNSRITPPVGEAARETSDFEWTALLNTVLSMVNGLEAHGHGGTLLVVAPKRERTLPVRMKFNVAEKESVLANRFVTFLNARHELTTARLKRDVDPSGLVLSRLQDAVFVAEEALADATDLVARLSAVDGALVVSADLRVLGFGAEIVLDAARPVAAVEATGNVNRASGWSEVDSESFGMRHRSALRCVAVAESAAAFVVSQDGTVSFFWKQDGRVRLKRGVTTANPIGE